MVLTKFEGTVLYNYSPLIRGYMLTNVALTGEPGAENAIFWRSFSLRLS
jgi:hypothetical protein